MVRSAPERGVLFRWGLGLVLPTCVAGCFSPASADLEAVDEATSESAGSSDDGDESSSGMAVGGDTSTDDGDQAESSSGGGESTSGASICGDGVADASEECDDANEKDADGCEADCTRSRVVQIATGYQHSCARFATGAVRCWGANVSGELGYGNVDAIGDDEPASSVGTVSVGGAAVQIVVGAAHTCALLETGGVRCWGDATSGQLGYGTKEARGDDELPSVVGDVPIGGTVVQLAAGDWHTCAVLDSGDVQCWGLGSTGQLGISSIDTIGDDEPPSQAGQAGVGGNVAMVSAGAGHTCARLEQGLLRCWGYGANGQLGYGNVIQIGDDEMPSIAGNVGVGGKVEEVACGGYHTCARLDTGGVRCWGHGHAGRLGYGSTASYGDDEYPAAAGDVGVGGSVVQLTAGERHTCALMDDGAVRCWGEGLDGKLGYAGTANVGDDEEPSSAGDVDVGGTVVQVSAGNWHTCAVLDSASVRCWGLGAQGQLGYGTTQNVGDDELPSAVGDVPLW